ncbi:CopD family protein [Saccharopolyspora sp. MS10]|uniref:CopD family protein n=1 Tax=Saccharopolyspora sp. MS10 TaxID=3385973 RepID=UPI0039A0B771
MPADPGSGPARADRRAGMFAPAILVPGLLAAVIATALLGASTAPGVPEPSTVVRYGGPLVRAALDLAAVATVGLALLPRLLPPRARGVAALLARSRRTAVITALAWLLGALLLLVIHTAELVGGSPSAQDVARYVTGVPAGTALALSLGCAAGCAALGLAGLVRSQRAPARDVLTDDLGAVLALLGLLPMPLTGHAVGWEHHELSMISAQLHVLAAAIWAGALASIALFVAPRRGLLATALPRCSKLATAAIVLVALSGAVNGLTELDAAGSGPGGLLTTGYGRIVLVKAGLLVLLAVLGGHARYRLLPLIERHRRTALASWAAVELTVMGLAYGLGAVLARAPVLG